MMRNQREERDLNILEELAKEDNEIFQGPKYNELKNRYGKKYIIKLATEFNEKYDEIISIIKEEYIKWSIYEQVSWPKSSDFAELVKICQRKLEVRDRCVRDWERYCQKSPKLGQFGKLSARLQPIEDFIKKEAWEIVIKYR